MQNPAHQENITFRKEVKKMKKRFSLLLVLLLATTFLTACGTGQADGADQTDDAAESETTSTTTSEADSWPSQTIYVTSTHSVGGDTDYNARLISKYLEDELGVDVVVSNITGGNGSTAMTEFQSMEADGYHFLMTNTVAIAGNEASGMASFGYEAFDPVAIFGRESGDTLIASPDMPFDDVNSFIEYTIENPGKVRLGIATGGGTYAAAVMLQEAGANVTAIDLGDGPERLAGVLGGHVDVAFCPFVLAKDYLEKGDVKALCTLMSQRSVGMPDTPTASELGVEDLVLDAMDVCVAVKGTDPAIIEKMNAAIQNIVNNNEEFRSETEEYNFQEPFVLNVDDTITQLQEQKDHFMSYADLIQGKK